MIKHSRLMIALASTLMLASCGEGSGWEMKLTNTMFPYGNQRTAGSGVAYVRAKNVTGKNTKSGEREARHDPSPGITHTGGRSPYRTKA